MSLLFFDGFDGYATTHLTRKWTSISGTPLVDASYGRNGQGCLLANTESLYKTVSTPGTVASGVFGGAFYVSSSQGLGALNITIGNSEGEQLCINDSSSDGLLSIRLGPTNGTILATGSHPITVDTWHHIQVKWTIANSGGTATVKVDGVEDATYTGDTSNRTTQSWTYIRINATLNKTFYVDDVWICDQANSVNDDFLGDCVVESLLPNGNGTNSEFDGSDGNSVDNYLLTDDTTPDDATTNTYVSSATVGERDTYAYASLTPLTATILGTQTCICAIKDGPGTRTYTDVVKLSGGSEDDGAADLGATTTYSYGLFPRDTKNGTDAWTVADVNASEFGVKVVS